MQIVSHYADFREKFERVKDRSNLFLFLLFDSRPSQIAVENFADSNFEWLDELAAASEMFGFVFLRRDHDEGGYANPSLEVAESFGIRPNQLPGIVLFSMYDDRVGAESGVFLPLKTKLFESRPEVVEEVVSDLFSIIQDVKQSHPGSGQWLDILRVRIDDLVRREQRRPLVEYASDTVIALVQLPVRLVETVSESFAMEAGRRLAGGI